MKKHFFSMILLALLCMPGKMFSLTIIDLTVEEDPFYLNTTNEIIQLSGAVTLNASALLCEKVFNFKENDFDSWTPNYTTIPYLDQFLMQDYNKALHYLGTGTAALSLMTPGLMLLTEKDQWLTVGVMYAESLLWAWGIKEWGKLLINRARPYMYYENYPVEKVTEGDWNCSFPSGHTSIAFTGAAFTTYLFNQYFPDSPWRFAVAGISFGIAATTGALRIASGNHFLSDVLTGALLGTICGFAVPFMHTTTFYNKFKKKNKTELTISPLGFNAKIYLN